jgi:hypothetical protein
MEGEDLFDLKKAPVIRSLIQIETVIMTNIFLYLYSYYQHHHRLRRTYGS